MEEDKAPPTVDAPPQATAGVGIIYPPPELRNIVDKTASFVAKNGWSFAERIRQEKEKEPKFKFLTPSNPYYAYFRQKVIDLQSASGEDTQKMEVEEETQKAPEAKKVEEEVVVAPPEPEFLAEPPTISAQELDIIKLTAQFVAKNGNQFLQELMQKEVNNYQFDFLRPQHTLFHYFTQVTEQYRKILMPRNTMRELLEREAADVYNVITRVTKAATWARAERKRKDAAAEADDLERKAYAQIDWHDFKVVATIEFTAADTDLLPPIKREELGARVVQLDKVEREKMQRAPAPPIAQAQPEEMEVEEEEEERQPQPAAAAVEEPSQVKIKAYDPHAARRTGGKAAATEEMLVSPLTGELIAASKMAEHMRISLLDPKWRESKAKQDEEAKKRQEAYAAQSASAMNLLKDFATRRSDIFGGADVDAEMGRKDQPKDDRVIWDGVSAGSDVASRVVQANLPKITEEMRKREREAAEAAKTAIGPAGPRPGVPASIPPAGARPPMPMQQGAPPPQQQQQPMATPGYGPPMGGPPQGWPRPGPPPYARPPFPQQGFGAPPPAMAGYPPQGMPPQMGPPGMPGMPPPQQGMQQGMPPPQQGMQQGMPPPQMGMGMPPRPMGMGMPPAGAAMGGMGAAPPPMKKTKLEEQLSSLQPQDVFLQTHSGTFSCKVVAEDDSESFGLVPGQTMFVTMSYTDTVADLKQKLQDQVSIPANKQKLVVAGIVLVNTNTLAFYNIDSSQPVYIGVKERGGKKK